MELLEFLPPQEGSPAQHPLFLLLPPLPSLPPPFPSLKAHCLAKQTFLPLLLLPRYLIINYPGTLVKPLIPSSLDPLFTTSPKIFVNPVALSALLIFGNTFPILLFSSAILATRIKGFLSLSHFPSLSTFPPPHFPSLSPSFSSSSLSFSLPPFPPPFPLPSISLFSLLAFLLSLSLSPPFPSPLLFLLLISLLSPSLLFLLLLLFLLSPFSPSSISFSPFPSLPPFPRPSFSSS